MIPWQFTMAIRTVFKYSRTYSLQLAPFHQCPSTMDKIKETEGDLFDAPDGAALIHACNCQGSWGQGIAAAFRERYPAAFIVYKSHCQKIWSKAKYHTIRDETDPSHPSSARIRLPEGTALIIPPQKSDYQREADKGERDKRHWIICLFTSRQHGRKVGSPATILRNTELAVADMKEQLARLGESDGMNKKKDEDEMSAPNGLWSCRFNSGLFRVEWSQSRRVLEGAGLAVTVVSPPGEG